MFPIPFNFPFRKSNGDISTIGAEISAGGGGSSYTLPTASADVKGGVKIGAGLTMDGEVLKNTNPTPATPYTLPTASAETLGGVKVGSNLSIDENGVLSASGGGGGGSTMHAHVISYLSGSGTRVRSFVFTVYVPTTDPILSTAYNWTIDGFIRALMNLNNTYNNGVYIPASGYVRSGTEGDFTSVTQFQIYYNSGTAKNTFRAYKGEDGTYIDMDANADYSSNRPKEYIF